MEIAILNFELNRRSNIKNCNKYNNVKINKFSKYSNFLVCDKIVFD